MAENEPRNPKGIDRYDASPVHTLNRFLETLDLEEQERTHLRLVIRRISDAEPDLNDIARQIVTRSLCATYAALITAQTKALRAKPGTKNHDTLWATTMRLQDHVTKLVRVLGLRGKGKSKGKHPQKAGGFTPPRGPRPSQAEAQALDSGDMDDGDASD